MHTFYAFLFMSLGVPAILFSISLLVVGYAVEPNPIFIHLGWYLFLIGLLSVDTSLIHIAGPRQVLQQLYTLQQFITIGIGFPLMRIIRTLDEKMVKLPIKVFFYTTLIVSEILIILDLIFGIQFLFYFPDPYLRITPLFKILYAPVLTFILAGICLMLFLVRKKALGINRSLVSILLYGLVIALPFELWDIFAAVVTGKPWNNPISLLWLKIMVIFAFIFIFAVKYLIVNFKYRDKPSRDSGPQDITDADRKLFATVRNIIIEQKLYSDPGLTLQKLADITGIPRNYISKAINGCANTSFTRFVNSFRIKIIKEKLESADSDLAIQEIGRQAGFYSRSTLNRIFSSEEGITPREYRKKRMK